MGGDEYLSARKAYDHWRMVKVARSPAELNYVAYFYLRQGHFPGKRSRSVVAHKEIVEKFHARPGRGAVVHGLIEPPESRSIIHNSRSRKDTLRGKIGAVSAYFAEIVILRVAFERPFFCISYRGCAVVFDIFHNLLYACSFSEVPFTAMLG